MINKDKIEYDNPIYYVPSYGGSIKVELLKLINDSVALVKPFSIKKDFKPFTTPLVYIFNTPDAAQRSNREWESYMKKRKKKK